MRPSARSSLPIIIMAGLALALPAAAQPVNDICATATLIDCNDVVSGTTVGANPESLPSCGTSDGSGGAVWYRFIGTGDEIEVTTCLAGSDYDTKLRVFSGSCGSLVCVTGNDDASCTFSGLRSRVTWQSVAGVEYKILVHGYSANQGNYELSLACLLPPAPDPNDLCVNATPVGEGTIIGDTPGNESDGSSSCGNADASPSVWYRFTATNDLTLRVRTCNSSYDSVVSIHSNCPGDTSNELACSDDACGDDATATTPIVNGQSYWIRVSGANGDSGPFVLAIDTYDPSQVIGPDVVYTDCTSITNWGAIGGTRAYSLGSYTCNIGDENLAWGGNTPLLGMNAYRLSEGRLVQIGMSWMKRGTGAAAGSGCGRPCNGAGGSVLGAGCRDIYGSGFNGSQSILGPRSQVNAHTGENPGSSGAAPDILAKRLQIAEFDLAITSDLYFVEGVYVAPDDAASGNALNNASYKRVTVEAGTLDMDPVGDMQTYVPAIQAWSDHGLGVGMPDPSVHQTFVDIPNEGRFHVASKVTDLGNGTWLYDYAIFNLNSHRSSGSLSIPLPAGASAAAIGFHDVDHHSGEPYDPTDWSATVGGGAVTWESPATFAVDPDSNALRFGTMYNFWFESNAAPGTTSATIGIFRPGTPDSVPVTVQGPDVPTAPTFRRGDCNDDGGRDISDAVTMLAALFPGSGGPAVPPCADACDANDDGATDIADPIALLEGLFSGGPVPPAPFPDCGTDPTADALDCASSASCP